MPYPVVPNMGYRSTLARVAEHQPEYGAVIVAKIHVSGFATIDGQKHNAVTMAFRCDAEERARLAAGDDIYITLLTFGSPQQPILVAIGSLQAREQVHV